MSEVEHEERGAAGRPETGLRCRRVVVSSQWRRVLQPRRLRPSCGCGRRSDAASRLALSPLPGTGLWGGEVCD